MPARPISAMIGAVTDAPATDAPATDAPATPQTRVRRLLPHERDAAVQTVVAAFTADPLLRWVWPDDARYADQARGFFGLLLDLRMEAGEAWGVDGTAAVAMWDPPGGLYVPPPAERWAAVQEGFSARERDQWATYDATMAVPADAGAHWYLGVLAADPTRARTGLGSAAVAPILAAADRAGLPAYLETASAVNLHFYRRQGFTPTFEATLEGGPTCWLLRRHPVLQ
jgi:GNAT superfamily N-acetyltransferase